MLSLIPLVIFFTIAAYLLAVTKMLTAALEAPIGYEDESGFHYGMPTRSR